MIWNNDKHAYFGTTSDGRTIRVDGDEYAESLQYGRSQEAEKRGYDPEDLEEWQRAECEDITIEEAGLDDPDMWAGLVGDNQNVEYVDA